MPRTARKISRTNIYHVMLRGINRQTIFQNDGDRNYFMKVLKACKEISGFKLHAFCLMPNHIHLLIEPADEPLELIFKRTGSRYAVWYNRKYQRVGHLFQDRFRSENVETDQYFMTVLRYILQNPMKAGIEERPGSYRWSSYLAYESGAGSVTDTQYALELFGGRDTLIDFVRQDNEDSAMDEADYDRLLRDEQAAEIMRKVAQCSTVAEFQRLGQPVRRGYAREMYTEGLSISQISRLTGMSKSVISRAVEDLKGLPSEAKEAEAFHEPSEFEFTVEPTEIW